MEKKKFLLLGILFLASTVLLPGCGSSDNYSDNNNDVPITDPIEEPVDEDIRENLTGGCGVDDGTTPPLSYEIRKNGSESYETPGVKTDNCLRVRFQVGATGGAYFDEADLRVDVSVNGSTKIPVYEVYGLNPDFDECYYQGGDVFECEYGRPSDGYSEIMDFSGHTKSGSASKIKVDDARYDWYCYLHLFNNGAWSSSYQPQTGCRKTVRTVHYWEGNLLVQTNETSNDMFNNP